MHFTLETPGLTPERKAAIRGFNPDGNLPPNLKEISAGNWAWGHESYSPTAELYVGHVKMPDGAKGTMRIDAYHGGYHNHGGGFATLFVYNHGGGDVEHSVRFFEWASCEHTRTQTNIGRCLNRYTCSKCGHFYDVDSSD